MITKLTADNAELYYAPRFAEITAAFQAAGQEIEITSLEDYFIHLPEIAALEVGAKEMPNAFLLVAPADEEIFTIDANTRAISVPAFVKKNGIGVYGDHRAEMIVMTIDRYFDHEDFLNDKIVINWNFTPVGGKLPLYEENQAAAAFAPNEELNPGLITFGFIITKDMTPEKGTLTFSVTIYDELSDEIVYSFNTLTAQVAINDTLTLKDPSIVKDDTNNYVGRLMGSVYTDNTIAPVDDPVWKSGEPLPHGLYSGLEKVAYFDGAEDLANNYVNGALLTAYAISDNSGNIRYKWTFNPVDGTIETLREFETVNQATDYVEAQSIEDNGEYYYVKDALGNIDISNPLQYAEAKALQDAQESDDEFLPLKVKLLETIPADGNAENCAFNQEHAKINVSGNLVIVHSDAELTSYESTNPEQTGAAQWVAFDIDTGLPSIIGVLWNGYELSQVDVDEADSVGLPAGHIVFWARANAIMSTPRNIELIADGYNPTTLSVSYIGVREDEPAESGYVNIINDTDRITFVVRGSSFRALSAGNYQVIAQARIDAGEKYEKVLDGADLIVNKEYFVKNGDEIDKLNPLVNDAARLARDNGQELYVRVGAARNSNPIESSVLVVPPAVQPKVVLSVDPETAYQFSDDVARDPDSPDAEKDYVYIDDTQIPTIVATVTVDSENAEDLAGAFAAELIEKSDPDLTLDVIEQKIADHELVFSSYPLDHQFKFQLGEIEEGEYVVRAINRRNGTYSVSENSDSIETSFVAPAITTIDVNAVFEDQAPIEALIGGQRPATGIKDFEISSSRLAYEFELIDHSRNFDSAVCTYFIEEVDYDPETGVITTRTPDEYGNKPGTNEPYDTGRFDEPDLREITEVVQDENDQTVYRFAITRDTGYYRIRTENRYRGTIHTAYTDIFGIISH